MSHEIPKSRCRRPEGLNALLPRALNELGQKVARPHLLQLHHDKRTWPSDAGRVALFHRAPEVPLLCFRAGLFALMTVCRAHTPNIRRQRMATLAGPVHGIAGPIHFCLITSLNAATQRGLRPGTPSVPSRNAAFSACGDRIDESAI